MFTERLVVCAALALMVPAAASADAQVRFVNATPAELQSIVVTIDGGMRSEIAFGRSTARLTIPDGTHRIVASTITEQGSVVLVDKNVSVQSSRLYTVLIWGALVPSAYDLTSLEDDGNGQTDHIRARYSLMSKGVMVEGTLLLPTLNVYCDGLNPLRVAGQAHATSTYVAVRHPSAWTGAACRVTLEVTLNNVAVPVWQDISNYFFTPMTNYTIVSIGTDPARVVVLREVDNK